MEEDKKLIEKEAKLEAKKIFLHRKIHGLLKDWASKN